MARERILSPVKASDEPLTCGCLWSLTMYSVPDFYLVDNPFDRCSIGGRTRMIYADDGTLVITISHTRPADDKVANNLAPMRQRETVARCYECPIRLQPSSTGRRTMPLSDNATTEAAEKGAERCAATPGSRRRGRWRAAGRVVAAWRRPGWS